MFKKTQDNHTSDYYCIVQGPKEFVGYFDRGIVYDEVNKQYVQFLDKEVNYSPLKKMGASCFIDCCL